MHISVGGARFYLIPAVRNNIEIEFFRYSKRGRFGDNERSTPGCVAGMKIEQRITRIKQVHQLEGANFFRKCPILPPHKTPVQIFLNLSHSLAQSLRICFYQMQRS